MTDSLTTPSTGVAPPWVTDLARSVLMSAGAGFIAKGYVSSTEWPQIVGGLLAGGSAAWSYLARRPAQGDAIAELRALIVRSGPANASAFDASLTEAEAWSLARALPVLDKVVAAHLPKLIRGPIETAAAKAATSAADAAVSHLKV